MIKVQDIKMNFQKAPKKQRQILLGALLVFVATFLPWSSVSMGMFGGFRVNGWQGVGMLSVLTSAGLILLWLLPTLEINLKLPIKTAELQKYLAIGMLAGPVLWLLQSGFGFNYLGLGFWLALVASGLTLSLFLKK
jgi:hypothetical protein